MTIPLYEHPVWQSIPGQVIRPGGLAVTEQALSFCNLRPHARVLDLGCGAGATLQYLSVKYRLAGFGVDVSPVLLARANRDRNTAGLAQARSEQLPLASATMDAVISECTLSLFETETALHEGVRVLKPGGYFVISDLYARNANGVEGLRRLPQGTCLSAAMLQDEIRGKLAACGLQIVIWQDCSQVLKEFPLCTLSTAAEVDPFTVVIAARKAELGYYFLVARKGLNGRT